jgi:hypothetical protein
MLTGSHFMKSQATILSVLLGIGLLANAASDQAAKSDVLRLLMSEVQPSMATSEQYCMLVFDDHRFHVEKAHRARGKDQDRKAYEGRLSDQDWNALNEILDARDFRELRVPRMPALVVENSHPYTISVARQKGFQNMEFLTKESLKPYQSELKPLLRWWKSAREVHSPDWNADVDSRCSLNDADAIFNN